MYQLVRDLKEYEVIFYWIDGQQEKISPEMKTIIHAREWIIDYHYSLYTFTERRRYRNDRRALQKPASPEAAFFCRRYSSNEGRRLTDQLNKVDVDLAIQKIQVLKNQVKTA
ncbi:hypothetical protein [Neptuniibacter halophilus]|uniref:hypothetical protein n=1 Tax=Neptuniibacter halophilus TaxID=651666 RepID=UPI002573DDA5|nr:hypothetical protein [Neptuniibacter halophilus]